MDNSQYVKNYKKEVGILLKHLDAIAVGKNKQHLKRTATHFIEKSIWWLTHTSGPVRAPGHAKHIQYPKNMPILPLGANTFNVGQSLLRCRNIIQDFLKKNMSTPKHITKSSLPEIRENLVVAIRSSVSNFQGQEYEQYSSMEGNEMIFGANAINVKDFIDYLFRDYSC